MLRLRQMMMSRIRTKTRAISFFSWGRRLNLAALKRDLKTSHHTWLRKGIRGRWARSSLYLEGFQCFFFYFHQTRSKFIDSKVICRISGFNSKWEKKTVKWTNKRSNRIKRIETVKQHMLLSIIQMLLMKKLWGFFLSSLHSFAMIWFNGVLWILVKMLMNWPCQISGKNLQRIVISHQRTVMRSLKWFFLNHILRCARSRLH